MEHVPSLHRSSTALPAPEAGHLSHHRPRCESLRDLPRRRRPAPLPVATEAGRRSKRLEHPRLLHADESLPPRRRMRAREHAERDASPVQPLRTALQRPARTQRASLPRPIQGEGHRLRRVSGRRVRLRSRQPGSRGALPPPGRMAVARRNRLRTTREREPGRGPAPTSRSATRRRSSRSAAGNRAHARPASSCESAWCPRR